MALATITGRLKLSFKIYFLSASALYTIALILAFATNSALNMRFVESVSGVIGIAAAAIIFLGLPIVTTIMFVSGLNSSKNRKEKRMFVFAYILPFLGSLYVMCCEGGN